MKTHHPAHRDASAILADINAIRNPVAGTLSEVSKTLKNGEETSFHILQYWDARRHVSIYIPPGKVAAVRAGVEGHGRLKALLRELSGASTHSILCGEADDPLKKKRRR
jgi:hypothetical protein